MTPLRLLVFLPAWTCAAEESHAVHAFWDDVNKQHTFHFPPAWNNEEQQGLQFYAYKTQEGNTEAVYDWWDDANKQHTFHMEPGWKHGTKDEKKGDLQFYAYKEEAANTEAIHAFWDDANKQHTFHFEPGWKHGDKDEVKEDLVFWAYRSPPTPAKPVELQSVFDFWDDVNKQHTFHVAPKWKNEEQGRVQFLAYDGHHEGTEAVYDFWDDGNKQHTFHFAPAWDGEKMGGVQYYAYRENSVADLIEIHDFWDDVNKQHTFHTAPAWPNEKAGKKQFYAFAPKDSTVQGVYAFWDNVNKQHTFHFPPAWPHGGVNEEQQGKVFSAYSGPYEGTDPVYDFWDDANKQHAFHFEPAVGAEIQGKNPSFWAHPTSSNPNLKAVYDYWDTKHKQNTVHLPPAWANEEQREIVFYAYQDDDQAWKPTTHTTTTIPPATGKLVFTTNSADLAGSAEFLATCNKAVESKGVTCTKVEDAEDGGGVTIQFSGSHDAIDAITAPGGFDDVVLDEVDLLFAPTGAKNPMVGVESADNSSDASASFHFGPADTVFYVGVSSAVWAAQAI